MRTPAAGGRTYFVAHPEVLTWRQLAGAIGRAVGRNPIRLRLPSAVVRAAGSAGSLLGGGGKPGRLDLRRARDLTEMAWTCRVESTREELGWTPEYDSAVGLRETALWYREHGWL